MGSGSGCSRLASRMMGKVTVGSDERRVCALNKLVFCPKLARQGSSSLRPENRKVTPQKPKLILIGQAKVVTIIQGGHVKISSPSLRPRLYLHSGDKGYIGGGSATGTGPSSDGGGGSSGAGRGTGGAGVADRRAESERQVR